MTSYAERRGVSPAFMRTAESAGVATPSPRIASSPTSLVTVSSSRASTMSRLSIAAWRLPSRSCSTWPPVDATRAPRLPRGTWPISRGCYPDEVMSQSDGHRVMLDAGIMTITPVTRTALTHAVGLSEKGKPACSGPLLVLSSDDDSRVDPSLPRQAIASTGLLAIDWVHAESDLLAWVQSTAMLDRPSAGELEAALAEYCTANPVSAPWAANAHNLLGVPS